jgi:rSAM/selenodomain-associated transferase 2
VKRLSVIVPTLDEAPHIAQSLQSLAAARRRGTEVIVVDGGSSDATLAVAEPHADVVLRAPRGRATQLNAGAQSAGGDALLFLHADSTAPENVDEILAAVLAERSMAWGRFDVQIVSERRVLGLVATMMNLRSRLSGIATGDQGIFVTRALFESSGGFPLLPLMEDIALSRTLKRVTAPLCLHEKIVTSGRRWERRGVARTILLMWRLRLAYYLGADPADLALRYDHVR